jgi:hypothetical protein
MRTIAWLLLTTVLMMSTGCARSDWIDRTLVTVDVTGAWYGRASAPPTSRELLLELEQKGSRVTGSLKFPEGVSLGGIPGEIDGTVAGDVFTFRQRNGAVRGELTVSGDEMTGTVSLFGTRPLSLRRVDSSARPSTLPR